jgi:aryl-alcohol dehydrogenase-like predicted oxidoreductase
MQKAGSTDPNVYKDHVMDVANAPGEEILPGELAKALEILADGGDVDYVGATGGRADRTRRIRRQLPRDRDQGRRHLRDRPVPLSGTTPA